MTVIDLCLVLVLLVALVVPATVYAAKPDAKPNAANVEIVKKGVPLPRGSGGPPGPPAATGTLNLLPDGGQRHAIIVGISDYPGDDHVLAGGYDLSYADDDAIAIYKVLLGYGFEPENVHLFLGLAGVDGIDALLTQHGVEYAPGACQLATPAKIKAAVAGLNVDEDDEVVFSFSGHGARLVPKPPRSEGAVQVGIVTWLAEEDNDFGYIWEADLKAAFKGIPARIVFVFDSCLAGGMSDLAEEGRVIIMACAKNGYAIEYGEYYAKVMPLPPELLPAEFNHGLFTGLLLQQLQREETVEAAFDGARAFLIGISRSIPRLQQIPCISDLFDDDLLL